MDTVVPRGKNNRDAASTGGHVSIADLPARARVRIKKKKKKHGPQDKTRTYCKSCGENWASSRPYDVVTTDGGLGVVDKNVVVSKRAPAKSDATSLIVGSDVSLSMVPTLKKDVGIPAARPITV
jgi:hypothetical protein